VTRAKILIVDDEPFNVDFLEQELDDQGYDTICAYDGAQALAQVREAGPDLVLLDIMMPVMDGFTVLERLKADPGTRDIPVVVISAVNDLASIVKGIKAGADDYLPKPFEPVLLSARIASGLDRKLRRDRELEYLREVERLTAAARSVRERTYDEASISSVVAREDALGNLARVFRRMAREVVAREQRLRQQLRQLELDIEEQKKDARDPLHVYVAMDRRQALANGTALPEVCEGSALFVDICGFTPLTESFARELGLQRGAEEVTRQVNRVHGALIECVHRRRGSIVGFGGDALICWFDRDTGLRGAACAFDIQLSMREFRDITAPGGISVSIGVKVALARGSVRRMQVGDPNVQLLDVLGGRMLNELAQAEHRAERGEIVATRSIVEVIRNAVEVSEWREDFALLARMNDVPDADPWPSLPADVDVDARSRPFLPPAVYEKVRAGQSAFLSELRPAASLFVRFAGIDFGEDAHASNKLDAFARFVQSVVARHDGTLLQLVLGDKACHFYATFGAPVAHYDDAVRAVCAALELQAPPSQFDDIVDVGVGIACGPIRAGAYGSQAQRSYSVIGDKTNLAARLMMEAPAHSTLCDEAVHAAARDRVAFETLAPIFVKGKSQPVAIFRPLALHAKAREHEDDDAASKIDRLGPAEQLTLKVASVIGQAFALAMLQDVHPEADARDAVAQDVDRLVALDLLSPIADGGERIYAFRDPAVRDAAYVRMLFAQRRSLHRAIAEWYERTHASDRAPHYATLARHWRAADEAAKAIDYLEKAGELAQLNGAYDEAQRYFAESLAIDRRASVLSADYPE